MPCQSLYPSLLPVVLRPSRPENCETCRITGVPSETARPCPVSTTSVSTELGADREVSLLKSMEGAVPDPTRPLTLSSWLRGALPSSTVAWATVLVPVPLLLETSLLTASGTRIMARTTTPIRPTARGPLGIRPSGPPRVRRRCIGSGSRIPVTSSSCGRLGSRAA